MPLDIEILDHSDKRESKGEREEKKETLDNGRLAIVGS